MSFELDEEILQDFLIEAGEILESLQEQLVELEKQPSDSDLLNAIFRGFHTVKGGAGFLSLTPMVDACHRAENVFDALRNNVCVLNAEIMDAILQVTDSINDMFHNLKHQQPLQGADESTLAYLDSVLEHSPEEQASVAQFSAQSTQSIQTPESIADLTQVELAQMLEVLDNGESPKSLTDKDLTDDEFDAMLAQLKSDANQTQSKEAKESQPFSDDINDDEFEALLDQLHGEGEFSQITPAAENSTASEDISEDEFEALLDQLHGKGQFESSQLKQEVESSVEAKPIAAVVSKPVTPPKKEEAEVTKVVSSETTVRVDTALLDNIMNMVGELVLVRNRLISIGNQVEIEQMSQPLSNLDLVTADLQGAVMKTRMQPIKKVFGRFPRVVRDLSRQLGKQINLTLEGEETDLDKNLVEALADPLIHIVRNSVDHGIEMPSERISSGKEAAGNIHLSASQEGDHILLTIKDDGAGMNANKLKQIAISRGVIDEDEAKRMSDQEAFNLIFAPGFSTKQEISDISGRGVGMDVVKTRIAQLNGSVAIESQLGQGTCLTIKVPLTLAIMPTLMVNVDKQAFALPLSNVNEIINLELDKTNFVDGQLSMRVRDSAIPLFYLSDWLAKGKAQTSRQGQHVVVLSVGNLTIGFVVDKLIGQEEVVIKPLGSMLHGTPGMAGATITSDGGIALILDAAALLAHYANYKGLRLSQ